MFSIYIGGTGLVGPTARIALDEQMETVKNTVNGAGLFHRF